MAKLPFTKDDYNKLLNTKLSATPAMGQPADAIKQLLMVARKRNQTGITQ